MSHALADMKFMSLFSMLFGAGIILLTDKLESTNRPVRRVWYLRLFWLLVFGLIHAWLLWYGDILVYYAIIGFVVFFFRKKSTKFLFRLGLVVFIIPVLFNLFNYSSFDFIPEEDVANIRESWKPTDEKQAKEVATMHGDFSGKVEFRMNQWSEMFVYFFLFLGAWRIMAMMLFGMYFYKKGLITAEKDHAFYKKLFLRCFAFGMIIIIYGIWHNFDKDWTIRDSMFLGSQFNYVGSFFVAISYMALVMWWSKSESFQTAKSLFQKVGKMAFTNYILMSVLCTFFFNVLGFFGAFSRVQQLLVTLIVWVILLLFTHIWFRFFKMGPLEWLWRSLTYLQWVEMKK